eukprot:TRINITY_DN2696_c1_g1_i1.p1 TRINITY_DN2696_c1_g1~~TRINITY_DN2696_c1_g1_i1.p1  ORF type:complete len:504 (-),score=210.27 TRINITY_DN2696_c1_g1_i1:8-1336(-)
MTEYKKRASALKEILNQESNVNPINNNNNTTNNNNVSTSSSGTTENKDVNKNIVNPPSNNIKVNPTNPSKETPKDSSTPPTTSDTAKSLKTSQSVPNISSLNSASTSNTSIPLKSSSTPSSPLPSTTSNPPTTLSFKWPLQSSSNPSKRSCVSIRQWQFSSSFSPSSPPSLSTPILSSTTRSCFLLWWLQAPTGSYLFEITNFQSQSPQSPSPTSSPNMNITFTVNSSGSFKSPISNTNSNPPISPRSKIERENNIRSEWKAFVEIWIDKNIIKAERLIHQGKNCVRIRQEQQSSKAGEKGRVYEGLLEEETMRPHEVSLMEIGKEEEGENVRIEKKRWVWDWKDVLEKNMEWWESWEKGDEVFGKGVERDLRELGVGVKGGESEEEESEEEEKGGVEVEVSNNVVMGEVVQMRYEMGVMRQEIKDLKSMVSELVKLLNEKK